MTAVGNLAPGDLWFPPSPSPRSGGVWGPAGTPGRRLRRKLAGQWQRIVLDPLLAIDRAGIVLSSSVSGTSTGVAPDSGGDSAPVQIASASEIHTLEPAAQLHYLVENYSDAVYRVARSVVRENELAEDASQEALLKAWQALPTFRGDAPLRNWVLRITHNTAVSILRTRREELRDPNLLPDGVQRGTIERSVEDTMAMTAFEDALGQLDELSRSIVVLREIENMSYDEISEVLDVPLPTVKTRLLRARKVLSSALQEWRP